MKVIDSIQVLLNTPRMKIMKNAIIFDPKHYENCEQYDEHEFPRGVSKLIDSLNDFTIINGGLGGYGTMEMQ